MTNKLIRVLHFDRDGFFSLRIRESLAAQFSKYLQINYQDLTKETQGEFAENQQTIESLLPDKDVLLIHPGVEGQKAVFEYPSRFPNLKIALVIKGDFRSHSDCNKHGIKLFDYEQQDKIVEWVLSHGAKLK